MKLIVGLGNPGREYEKTRHNAGFMVIDELAKRHAPIETARARFQSATIEARIGPEKCMLIKPTTFMNLSGRAVGEATRFFKLDHTEDLIVVTDDIALPVGAIRVRAKGGDGGHNGLSNISQILGTQEYTRVRVGVGAVPKPMNQADWVLSRFTDAEIPDFERSIKEAAGATERAAAEGTEAAMNAFNKKIQPETVPRLDGKPAGDSETKTQTKAQPGDDPGWFN